MTRLELKLLAFLNGWHQQMKRFKKISPAKNRDEGPLMPTGPLGGTTALRIRVIYAHPLTAALILYTF